jgi:HAD superfamily hydrolase (TIGR01458 family)
MSEKRKARGAIRGVALDLDGVLYVEGRVIAGATEAVARLSAAGVPFRYVTNTTSRGRRALATKLAALGFRGEESLIVSPASAAAAWLERAGVRRVALLVAPDARGEFARFEQDTPHPEAVIVGDMGDAWTPAILNRALGDLLRGAVLIALGKSRTWRRESGIVMDAGPYVAALEYAARVEARVIGKPAREFFEAAARALGLPPGDVVMIGDDPETDVAAAISAGMAGWLVLSGKTSAPPGRGPRPRPHAVFPSIVEAVDALLSGATTPGAARATKPRRASTSTARSERSRARRSSGARRGR